MCDRRSATGPVAKPSYSYYFNCWAETPPRPAHSKRRCALARVSKTGASDSGKERVDGPGRTGRASLRRAVQVAPSDTRPTDRRTGPAARPFYLSRPSQSIDAGLRSRPNSRSSLGRSPIACSSSAESPFSRGERSVMINGRRRHPRPANASRRVRGGATASVENGGLLRGTEFTASRLP